MWSPNFSASLIRTIGQQIDEAPTEADLRRFERALGAALELTRARIRAFERAAKCSHVQTRKVGCACEGCGTVFEAEVTLDDFEAQRFPSHCERCRQ